FTVGASRGTGASITEFHVNVGTAQETTITTSGGIGEAEYAGVVINFVPREGGNTTHGSAFANFANSGMQSNNFTDALKQAGLTAPNQLIKVWEVSPMIGGPILRDKLWYLTGYRSAGVRNYVANMFANQNANDPTKWTYVPDLTRRALNETTEEGA